jgi:hypothetical protein
VTNRGLAGTAHRREDRSVVHPPAIDGLDVDTDRGSRRDGDEHNVA